MAEDETARVAQYWPVELRDRVKERVGNRGVTAFTIDAVQEKLARESAEASAVTPPTARPSSADVAAVEKPVVEKPAEPVPDVTFDSPITVAGRPAVERGEAVAVAAPTLGVAAQYSSSSEALAQLMAKAEGLGIKKASDLPVPVQSAPEPAAGPVAESVTGVEPEPVAVAVDRNLDEIDVDF